MLLPSSAQSICPKALKMVSIIVGKYSISFGIAFASPSISATSIFIPASIIFGRFVIITVINVKSTCIIISIILSILFTIPSTNPIRIFSPASNNIGKFSIIDISTVSTRLSIACIILSRFATTPSANAVMICTAP